MKHAFSYTDNAKNLNQRSAVVHHLNEHLTALGLGQVEQYFWNLPTPALYEEAIRNGEGLVTHLGPLVVETGKYTGRSPNDKFIVATPDCQDKVSWGKVNQAFSAEKYEQLRQRVVDYLGGQKLYVQDLYAGADSRYEISLRVISESAWHALFARTMFILHLDREAFQPEFTVLHAPHFLAEPERDGTHSEVFIILNFERKEILIGGSRYAGEVKKSVFTLMNYLLPNQGVLSMHCSANYGSDLDDVALFFGLSGTGKTTLSIDPTRKLVGDDEHGWSDAGSFNIEGGCYAKIIRISQADEPEIFKTTRMFGTIIENVPIDKTTRRMDLNDDSLTENTRAAFPIRHLDMASDEQAVGHPKNIFFLTADAFGVLPPLSKLTPEQAIYYFLLGYTAKIAGTERGVAEPQATFSACFGAPFMVHPATVYAEMLGEKIRKHGSQVWLVNTGWTGAPHGVGERIKLRYTRSMVQAVMGGNLDRVSLNTEPYFGLQVPSEVQNVPSAVLLPQNTWADAAAYEKHAKELANSFVEHFKEFEGRVSEKICAAGPPQ